MACSLIVDMNLTPDWVGFLLAAGFPAQHWTQVGVIQAIDSTIMAWASANGHVVLTHDFDFATLLALTNARGPSVVQIRGNRVLPEHVGEEVLSALNRYAVELSNGALINIEAARHRVRVLPFKRDG